MSSETPNLSLVKELTDKNFSTKDNEKNYVLVDYYASWCPHCRKLSPHYELAAEKINRLKLNCRVVKLDADKYEKIGFKNQVRYFPDVRLYCNGKLLKKYEGPIEAENTSDKITMFVKEHAHGINF